MSCGLRQIEYGISDILQSIKGKPSKQYKDHFIETDTERVDTFLIQKRGKRLLVDMEAGIEHLGRATHKYIDRMLIIVEPGSNSIQTPKTIIKLGKEIGIDHFEIIGNKIQEKKIGSTHNSFTIESLE